MVITSASCRYSVDSEYRPLKAVLLYKPSPEIEKVDNPSDVLFIKNIDYKVIEKEYEEIIRLYKKLKIKVYFINPEKSDNADNRYLFNLMYTRDLLFMTPEGAIVSSMAHKIRQGEVKYTQRTLESMGIPIRKSIEPPGTFEGADALWVNGGVVVGVGGRTNPEGFLQVRDELKTQDIDCVSVPVSEGVKHLLGALQFVDKDLVLVRIDLVSEEIISFLRQNKIDIIRIPENDEVRERQAMNIVTIAPREIIMPADCPETKKIYESYGIRIAAEVKISQLINGGGGLACATGIIARQAS